jgi:hypothetical protein
MTGSTSGLRLCSGSFPPAASHERTDRHRPEFRHRRLHLKIGRLLCIPGRLDSPATRCVAISRLMCRRQRSGGTSGSNPLSWGRTPAQQLLLCRRGNGARDTRRFLETFADSPVMIIPAHFPTPNAVGSDRTTDPSASTSIACVETGAVDKISSRHALRSRRPAQWGW